MTNTDLSRLRWFVIQFSSLLDRHPDEDIIIEKGSALLGELVKQDDWLPVPYAEPSPDGYRQYLLHCDSGERFSIVSFVWGPGQCTPIHNHGVWGLIGILRGAETSQSYRRNENGSLALVDGPQRLEPGNVECVSPTRGDIHRVSNAFSDRTSISIHVYGTNIGRHQRTVYSESGETKRFISGYSNTTCPNFWGN